MHDNTCEQPGVQAGQLTSAMASWTALSMSFGFGEFLRDVLFALQRGLADDLFDRALPDDDQGGLPVVDELPELLEVGAGHAAPQVAAHPADGRAARRGGDDRGRE